MNNLFTPPPPGPGEYCPTCHLVVPHLKLRTGHDHPETSHAAGARAGLILNDRHLDVLRVLEDRGPIGATDDEIDFATEWGHQSTTPVMNALRNARQIAWAVGADGKRITRLTRKGNPAGVNVLAKYVQTASAGGPT